MSKEHPDHHDAEIAFHAYEMRREPVMRESRNAINRDYWPRSADEALAVLRTDHPLNRAWRQVTGRSLRRASALTCRMVEISATGTSVFGPEPS